MTVLAVSAQRLPNTLVGEAFALDLPRGAELLRAGIDPASGGPAIWFHYPVEDPQPVIRRKFFVIEHSLPNVPSFDYDDEQEHVVHRGMWWAAAQTYHLFELLQEEV